MRLIDGLHSGLARGLLAAALLGCGETGTDSASETGTAGTSETGEPTGTTFSEACLAASAPSWDSFGRDFFATYCARCHSETLKGAARSEAPYDHNFDTVELVRMQTDAIAAVAAGTKMAMPLGDPKPSDAERVTLGEWLACGAP